MVICKSFQNSKIGYCRFGSNCVFEHVDIKKIVETEAELAIESSQWVLSCFGPFKEKTCIPNFIDDQSFEEVRLLWYEAKQEDRLPQFQQKYNLQVLEAKYKMVQLTFLSSEVLKTLTKIFDSDTEANKNIFIGATNPFSSHTLPFSSKSTNNSCIFGINQIQANPFAKSTSINFGSNTSTPIFNSSIFRSVNASSSENNTQKQSSIFGSELVIQKQQKNPFGESLIKQSILSSDQTKEQKSGMLVKNSQNKELTSPNKLFSLPSTLPNPNEPIDSPFKAIGPSLGTDVQKTLPNPNEPIDSPFKAIGPSLGTTIQKTLPNPNEPIDSPFKAINWDSRSKPFAETEFKNQINRLEKIIERLERLVPEKQLEIANKVYNSVIETTEQLQNQCNLEDTLNNNQEDENNSVLNLNNNLVKYRKEDDNCREEENTDILNAYNRSISRSNSPPLFVPFVSNIKTKVYDLPSNGRTKIKCLEKITNVPFHFKPLIYKEQKIDAPLSLSLPQQTSTITDAPLSLSPPQFKKIDKKWIIEHQKSNQNLLIEDAKIDNMIKMYECENSILTIKGKVNSVFMDSCKKCYLFVDSVVSSIEFVNCQSVQMQILKKCPTISIKKTDGCQMYLTKNSLDVEILSSKSSKMNAMIPKDNGDYIGQLIPEQYRTLIKGTSLQTTCVESEYFLK